MDEPRIRAATAADVPAIADIVEQAYRHYVDSIGKPPGPMAAECAARDPRGPGVGGGGIGSGRRGRRYRHYRSDADAGLSAPRQYRRFARSPGLRIGPATARIRGGRGIAARLLRNPTLHASNDGGESAPLRF